MNGRTYDDKWLRIVGYPVLGIIIRHFGEMGSLAILLKTPLYYFDIGWNTLIVAASWEANRALIVYLDNRYPWTKDTLKRFVIQFSVAMPMSFFIAVPFIYIYNEVLTDHGTFDTANLFVMDLPLILVFTTMVHMIYIGLYFNGFYREQIATLQLRVQELETAVAGVSQASELEKPSGFREILIVNKGSSSVPIHTGDIAYARKVKDLTLIKTFQGQDYSSSSSLDSLEHLLEPGSFFRFNRQVIGNIKAVRQFKPDESGKLLLELTPPSPEEVSVSKKRAAEFRSWVGRRI